MFLDHFFSHTSIPLHTCVHQTRLKFLDHDISRPCILLHSIPSHFQIEPTDYWIFEPSLVSSLRNNKGYKRSKVIFSPTRPFNYNINPYSTWILDLFVTKHRICFRFRPFSFWLFRFQLSYQLSYQLWFRKNIMTLPHISSILVEK